MPYALRTLKFLRDRPIPVDRDESLELQNIAALEIDEQERRARLADEIAERIEEAIAAKVRNGQRVALDAHESRSTAAMGDIGAAGRSGIRPRAACHEEGVGRGDECPGIVILETLECMQAARSDFSSAHLAPLDVLRTIAETLLHGHGEARRIEAGDDAICAIAPSRGQLDAQDSHFATDAQRACGRVIRARECSNMQRDRIRCIDEARIALEQRGERPTFRVGGGNEDLRQRGKKVSVLIQHEIADAAAPDIEARPRLRGELVGVEAFHARGPQLMDAAAAGTGDDGIGWNRGNASTRASHRRTLGYGSSGMPPSGA